MAEAKILSFEDNKIHLVEAQGRKQKTENRKEKTAMIPYDLKFSTWGPEGVFNLQLITRNNRQGTLRSFCT